MSNYLDKITIGLFALTIFGIGIAFFATPDVEHSRAERRVLARAPEVSFASILDGSYMRDLETYMQDQFPARENFRMVNAMTRRYLLGQWDFEGYFFAGGHLSQMEFPLNRDAVEQNAAWLANVANHFFADMNVYYAIIPDKNYFLAPAHGFLHLDYAQFMEIVHRRMGQFEYINLFEVLEIGDFYRTDIHWRQENLQLVTERLLAGMGADAPDWNNFEKRVIEGFRGNFHGAAALPVRADDLIFMTNSYTDSAVVRTLIERDRQFVFSEYVTFQGEQLRLEVYNPALFAGLDGYDVFLAGAQAIMTIHASNATTDRELIIFRDSFGSSIAPLFLGTYSKITLIDIRYIPTRLLPEFIDFIDQDVLFLYSVPILNRGGLFR